MFERYLPGLSNKRILDVGCGQGMMMDYFINKGNRVVGIDITHQSVKYNVNRGLKVIEADARSLPFESNSFDLVYSLGVIEHFQGTEKALGEQVRVCTQGGTVIAVVPNLLTLYCLAGIPFELLTKKNHKLIVTYGKPFTRRTLGNMLKNAGCERIRVEPYYGSAFLQVFVKKNNARLIDIFEETCLSRYLGLVLWGIGYKRGDR